MKKDVLIRNNVILSVNPQGIKENVKTQIEEIKNKPKLTDKPLNVLIIGGSSGYGLASRIVLNELTDAKIINVSFERPETEKRPASAGFYQNEVMVEAYPNTVDLMGDAFSDEMKQSVVNALEGEKLDLIIYSLASGIRIDSKTNKKYVSSLKPVSETYTGLTVDIAKETLKEVTLEKATQEEIDNTIKVMGGEDYLNWIDYLLSHDALNENIKAVTYTYYGPKLTHPIYKNGTIGLAKRDLEEKNELINQRLAPLHGKAYLSASKAVITKASIFIPTMALYASALFKVMKEAGVHETITEHKYRMFKDFIFNDTFKDTVIPLDAYEMDPKIQDAVDTLLSDIDESNFKDKLDFEAFKAEFLALNGF